MSAGRRGYEIADLASSGWTEERIALCKRLYIDEGASAAETAARLGGITRMAVIGKARRMGWTRSDEISALNMTRNGRATGGGRAKGAAPVRKPATIRVSSNSRQTYRAVESAPLPPAPIEDVATVTLLELRGHHCRWPVGTPGEDGFGFCGDHPPLGRPYCPRHVARATGKPAGILSDRAVGLGDPARKHARTAAPTFEDFERRRAGR